MKRPPFTPLNSSLKVPTQITYTNTRKHEMVLYVRGLSALSVSKILNRLGFRLVWFCFPRFYVLHLMGNKLEVESWVKRNVKVTGKENYCHCISSKILKNIYRGQANTSYVIAVPANYNSDEEFHPFLCDFLHEIWSHSLLVRKKGVWAQWNVTN